jgi:hypothetical protein
MTKPKLKLKNFDVLLSKACRQFKNHEKCPLFKPAKCNMQKCEAYSFFNTRLCPGCPNFFAAKINFSILEKPLNPLPILNKNCYLGEEICVYKKNGFNGECLGYSCECTGCLKEQYEEQDQVFNKINNKNYRCFKRKSDHEQGAVFLEE